MREYSAEHRRASNGQVFFSAASDRTKPWRSRHQPLRSGTGYPCPDGNAIDGVHFDAPEHAKLGNAIADEIRKF